MLRGKKGYLNIAESNVWLLLMSSPLERSNQEAVQKQVCFHVVGQNHTEKPESKSPDK